MSPTASELKAVPVPRESSKEGKGGGKRRVVDSLALDGEEKTYPLTQNIAQRAPENINWERLDVMNYIGFGKYLDATRFSIFPVKDREFCITTIGLIRSTAHGAVNQQECGWEPLQRLELHSTMNVLSFRDPGKLVHARRMDKLYLELHLGNLPVLGFAYCYYAAPYDHLPFCSFSMLWRSSTKFEYKNRTDVKGSFSLMAISGSSKRCLRRVVCVVLLLYLYGFVNTGRVRYYMGLRV